MGASHLALAKSLYYITYVQGNETTVKLVKCITAIFALPSNDNARTKQKQQTK